jgi:molybdate transport system substrate-binding protein
LIKQGKIASASRTTIARSNLAVAMKAGAKKTDIHTSEGFKRALLGAKAVAFAREGASGIGFMEAMKKLGISEQVKQMPTASGEAVGEAVVKGTADLGILPLSEILPIKGAEVLGEFPPDVASFIVMVGGVNASNKETKASKGLIDFLTAPAATPVVKAKGMERVAK